MDLTEFSRNNKLVGFSIQGESQLISSLILSKFIKDRYKSNIVLGGPYITAMCKEPDIKEKRKILFNFFEQFPFIDYLIVIVGHGEIPLFNLWKFIEGKREIEEIPNIIYLANGKIKMTNYSDILVEDYNIHEFDGLPINEYKQLSDESGLFYYPITRECLYKCTFCSARCIDSKPLCRNPRVIIEDLKMLHWKYKIDKFLFGADMININENHINEICENIFSENLNIKWTGIAVPKGFSFSLLKKMKKACCVKLCFGTESGSPKVLTDMNKPYTIEDVQETIEMCHKVGIKTNLYFIIGFPTETDEDFNLSTNFIVKNKKYITNLTLNFFHLDRNSPIYLTPKKFGIFNITPYSFWDIPFGFDCKFDKDDKTFEEIVEDMKRKMRMLETVLIRNNIPYIINVGYGYKPLVLNRFNERTPHNF